MKYKIFYLEPTKTYIQSLRRYASYETTSTCWHDALVEINRIEAEEQPASGELQAPQFKDNPNWPKKCARCDYVFKETDKWQVFYETIWKRADTGELMTLRNAPVGAVWDATWLKGIYKTADGRVLICRLPENHDWNIDGQASNCSRPKEHHFCWIRHGKPEDGTLNVNKEGDTCSAGAGSIWVGMPKGWHGFLRNGYLIPC